MLTQAVTNAECARRRKDFISCWRFLWMCRGVSESGGELTDRERAERECLSDARLQVAVLRSGRESQIAA